MFIAQIKLPPEVAIPLAILGWVLMGVFIAMYTWSSIQEEGKPAWFRLAGWSLPIPAALLLFMSYGTGARYQPYEYPVMGPLLLSLAWGFLALSAVFLVRTQRRKAGLTISTLGFLLFALKPFIQPSLFPIKVGGKWNIIPVGMFAGYHLYFWAITIVFAVLTVLLWRGVFGEMKR